jgi:hypothetical protein
MKDIYISLGCCFCCIVLLIILYFAIPSFGDIFTKLFEKLIKGDSKTQNVETPDDAPPGCKIKKRFSGGSSNASFNFDLWCREDSCAGPSNAFPLPSKNCCDFTANKTGGNMCSHY